MRNLTYGPDRFRFPLPCRFPNCCALTRLPDELLIHDPPTADPTQGIVEPALIGVLPSVEPKGLLVQIPEQVKRLYRYVSAFDGTLEEAPVILDVIGMHVAFDVAFGVIDDLMHVLWRKPPITRPLIGKDL